MHVLINLDRRPDRLAASLARLAAVGYSPARVPAVDGRTLPPLDPDSTLHAGLTHPADPMTSGAKALTLTTLAILRKAQRQCSSHVLIFEDDVGPVVQDGPSMVAAWRRRHDAFWTHLPDDWEMAFLGIEHVFAPEPTDRPGIERALYAYGCHAYAVRHTLYSTLIELLEKHVDALPIDVVYSEFIMPRRRTYAATPVLFQQGYDAVSDIRVVPKPIFGPTVSKRNALDAPLP